MDTLTTSLTRMSPTISTSPCSRLSGLVLGSFLSGEIQPRFTKIVVPLSLSKGVITKYPALPSPLVLGPNKISSS